MVDFIVLTLLFLDTNSNNFFDSQDNIININSNSIINQNVYCKVWSKDLKLCGYSWQNTNFINEDENDKLLNSLEWKHYIYNSEIFEKWYKPGRVLYAEYIWDKYIFIQDENLLNKENIIYSLSNDDSLYMNQIYKKFLVWIFILIWILWAWIFLFPKKTK